jgi:hypothetical protein
LHPFFTAGAIPKASSTTSAMKRSVIIALILINLGVFFGATAFLPRALVFSSTGPISHFINARNHWEVAILITLSSTCITCGIAALCRPQNPPTSAPHPLPQVR